jgi:rubrerythrin
MASVALHLNFDRFFAICETHRWKLEQDVDWAGIQRDLVSDEELKTLRRAALVEGYTPGYAADLVPLFVDEPEMSAFFSIQHYEEFKHYHALRRYLRLCGIEIDDEEVCAPRRQRVHYADKLVPILKFGISEIFTAIFYREISRQTQEPVLKKLANFISEDEYRHLSWYTSYFEWYVKTNAITPEHVTAAISQYQHQGLDAIGDEWVDHWNRSGERYTKIEPYLYLRNLLDRVVGRGVDLKALARRTTDTTVARTFA